VNGKRQTRAATGWPCPAALVEKENSFSHQASCRTILTSCAIVSLLNHCLMLSLFLFPQNLPS